jgi:hypothetical protein
MKRNQNPAVTPSRITKWRREDLPHQRAKSLLDAARHWLRALEEYANLKDAMSYFVETSCARTKFMTDPHFRSIRLEPQNEDARRTYITCIAPRADIPDDLLESNVLEPLRDEGFEVGRIRRHNCGCTTFTVKPHSLARA